MNAKRSTPREAAARVVAKATGTAGATGPTGPIETLLGSSVQPALVEIGEAEVQLGTIVAAAHSASGLSIEAWNALAEADREKLLADEIERRRSESAPSGSPTNRPSPEQPASSAWPPLLAGMPSLEEIDAEISLLVAELRQGVAARDSGEGVKFVQGMQLGLRRLDAAVSALLLELGGVPIDPASPTSPLPAEVPEGKVRVRVRGPQSGRRRLGRHFTPEPQDLDVSDDELTALRADSELTVREIGFQD